MSEPTKQPYNQWSKDGSMRRVFDGVNMTRFIYHRGYDMEMEVKLESDIEFCDAFGVLEWDKPELLAVAE